MLRWKIYTKLNEHLRCSLSYFKECSTQSSVVCLLMQRQHNLSGQSKDIICQENMRDIIGAFGIALLANIAVLVVAASTFHNVGIVILTLQDAHALMEQVAFVLSFLMSCNTYFKQFCDSSLYALYIPGDLSYVLWWGTNQSGFGVFGLGIDIE